MNLKGDRLSYAVIGKAMDVHTALGPGLDECFYQELLASKLTSAGIPYEAKPRRRLLHRGIEVDVFEPDFLIASELIGELKVLRGGFSSESLLQVICYLKFFKLQTGLLFDYGKERLSLKRIAYTERPVTFQPDELRAVAPPLMKASPILEMIGKSTAIVANEHGLGYRDTTYQGLLFAELCHHGVPCLRNPSIQIQCDGRLLGETQSRCIVILGSCVLLITALCEGQRAADRAILQTYCKHLQVPWGIHFNFGKTDIDFQFATLRGI